MQEIVISLVVLWRANSNKFAMRISTSAANFGLVRNSPARSIIFTVINEALGMKAKRRWAYCGGWCTAFSLVITADRG